MSGAETVSIHDATLHGGRDDEGVLGLVVAWSAGSPERLGEIALVGADQTYEYGRDLDGPRALSFIQQRPHGTVARPPIGGPGISRRQLKIRGRPGALAVESVGRCAMLVGGVVSDRAVLVPGDTLLLKGQLLLLCVARSRTMTSAADYPRALCGGFGTADQLGFVGESPALWELRDQLAFSAKAALHVLLTGESGTGKELAARAIHALSARAKGPFVSRNAATIPASLMDAELFGNVKNYPNPGTPERLGLIGEASGGTLFLDEIGELDVELQSHLLRILDGPGEYHRLGDATPRRSDLRLVAATNRDPTELKHDLVPRLALRLEMPPLSARIEDIPLLVQHLLERGAARAPEAVNRFRDADGNFALEPSLIEALLHWPLAGNVRDLDALLWAAMRETRAGSIGLPKEMKKPPRPAEASAPPALQTAPKQLDAETVRAAIEAHSGNLKRAAEALGLPSRYGLYRVIKRFGISLDDVRTRALGERDSGSPNEAS